MILHDSELQGAGAIARLVGESGAAKGPIIIAAGGITDENVGSVISRTGVTEVHTSAKR
jgi:copper homeostasis protein CutC